MNHSAKMSIHTGQFLDRRLDHIHDDKLADMCSKQLMVGLLCKSQIKLGHMEGIVGYVPEVHFVTIRMVLHYILIILGQVI